MVDHFDQLDSCEFWLPPEFLSDEDFDFEVKKKDVSDSFSGFGSSGTNSDLSSPGDSVVSSTESESDEDEYITALTHKMANSTLQDKKELGLSSSPKSPLCKAAGEFSRRKMVSETAGLLPPSNQQFVRIEQKGPNIGFPTNTPPQLSYQQLLAIRHLQFEQVRRHQMMNQAHQNRGVKNGERMPTMALPVSGWPQVQRSQPQPQPGTGMRAVFLGNTVGDATKPRAGTGVFLPRTAASTENRKKKPACAPVLIPDRVVQSLNLNLGTFDVHNQPHHRPGYNNNGFPAHYAATLNYNSKMKKNPGLRSIAREEPENQEVFRLPSEWTY